MVPVSLPVDARSAATARTLLRAALKRLVPRAACARSDETDSAALMVSELVTNAVRHTLGLLLLDVRVCGTTLRVDVVDDAPGPVEPAPDDLSGTGGRGLRIVEALADRWGVVTEAGRKTVWFELTLHPGRV